MKNGIQRLLLLIMGLIVLNVQAASNVSIQLERYAEQGVTSADTDNGARLWNAKNGQRSCTSCHSDSPLQAGKHVKTGKPIKPMAVSVNPERYAKQRKMEKWFKRNCKWTFGRQCSVQEKADILSWLATR